MHLSTTSAYLDMGHEMPLSLIICCLTVFIVGNFGSTFWWDLVGATLPLQPPTPSHTCGLAHARGLARNVGKCSDSFVILVVWCLLVQRNDSVLGKRREGGGSVVALVYVFYNHCDQCIRAGLVDQSLLLGE
jgi:hypothetical protein